MPNGYIELYRTPSSMFAPTIINVSQYDFRIDSGAEELTFRVKDDNGHYIGFSSYAVWLIAARPDGVIYEISGRVKHWNPNDGTLLEFKLNKGVTDVPGDVICEVVWMFPADASNNQALSIQRATQNFIMRVEPSPKEIYGNNNTIIDDSGGGYDPYQPDDPPDTPQYRMVIASPPNKTSYDEGDSLNLTGVVVNLEKYTDSQGVLETTNITSSCTFSPASGATLTPSNTSITVTYVHSAKTLTGSIPITVAADPKLYRLKVASAPTKTTYYEGDTLDLSGVQINLEEYTAKKGVLNTTNVTSSCTFSPANGTQLTSGNTSVTATYIK